MVCASARRSPLHVLQLGTRRCLAWLGFRFEHELVAIKRDGTMRLQDHQHWEVIRNLIDIITGAQSSLVDIHPRRHGVTAFVPSRWVLGIDSTGALCIIVLSRSQTCRPRDAMSDAMSQKETSCKLVVSLSYCKKRFVPPGAIRSLVLCVFCVFCNLARFSSSLVLLGELEIHVLIHTGVEHVRTIKIPSFSLQSLRVC